MNDFVRVGVIGTSGWADFMYLSSLKSHPRAKLTAICGRNQDSARALAAKYDIPQVYADYQDMLQPGELDAVIVGTPDDLHHAITLQALEAGCHVLCDKPLAQTVEQAQEMHSAAIKARRKHMVLFTFRWMPFYRYIKDLVDQGLLGRCYHSEFRFVMGYARKPEYQWRLDRKRANGALGDLGVHMIDMARWLVGEISQVNSLASVFIDRSGAQGREIDPANDLTSLLVQFTNGAHGLIHASLVTHLGDRNMQQQIRLYGEGGSLELDVQYQGAEAGAHLSVARAGEDVFRKVEVPTSYWGEVQPSEPFRVFTQHRVGCRAFIDAILEDRPCTPDFYDGYQAQQVISAALEAAETGKRIILEKEEYSQFN